MSDARMRFRVKVGRLTVASTDGPWREAEAEAMHYAIQYREEGDVTVQREEVNGASKWWKRHALLEQWPLPATRSEGETG